MKVTEQRILDTLAFLFLAAIVWGLCLAAVPAVDAELNYQAEQAKTVQTMLKH